MTGKISRLPFETREELNRRMDQGQTGKSLVQWLNSLPEVQAVLKEQFGGRPINEPNLSQWKARGYREWQLRRETIAQAHELSGTAAELNQAGRGKLTRTLSTLLAARYAVAVAGWNGHVTEDFRREVRALRSLCRDVTNLRRCDQLDARMKIDRERLQLQNVPSEQELIEYLKQLDATSDH